MLHILHLSQTITIILVQGWMKLNLYEAFYSLYSPIVETNPKVFACVFITTSGCRNKLPVILRCYSLVFSLRRG